MPRPGRRRLVTLGVALGLVVWFAAGWWVSERLLVPRRALPDAPPAGDGLRVESLVLDADDGPALAAWIVEPVDPPPGAVCLLFHATDGHRSSSRAAWAAGRGMAVLAVDLRAHGESTGERTGFGWRERADVAAAVEQARRRWPDLPLVGWGTSLGAAALVLSVDPAHDDSLAPDTFAALVLESLYADLDTAFENRVELMAGRWAMPLAWPLRWIVLWRTGLSPEDLAPADALGRLVAAEPGVEVLLATGSLDRLSTPAELERLAAASGGRAVLVDGGHHADLMGKDDGAWLAELQAFFHRWGGR